jgi:porin
MPGGGPAYPLSALGGRIKARPREAWTFLAGAFNGSPASRNAADSQADNPSGTSFRLDGSALGIAELQYAYPSLGAMILGGKKTPLARVYKLGAWYNSEIFDDKRFDNTGLSLYDPNSTGVAQKHRGDYALYAVADQSIWQSAEVPDRALNLFIRPMGTPLADRNQIDFSINAGLTFSEPVKHRDDDSLGIGMGYAHVSNQLGDLDKDYKKIFSDPSHPVRSGETFVEATYQYQATPWWQIQPDFQYIFNPGAGVVNPKSSTGERVKNEAVIGLRMNFVF